MKGAEVWVLLHDISSTAGKAWYLVVASPKRVTLYLTSSGDNEIKGISREDFALYLYPLRLILLR